MIYIMIPLSPKMQKPMYPVSRREGAFPSCIGDKLPQHCRPQKLKSTSKSNPTDPIWDEAFTLEVFPYESLHLKVMVCAPARGLGEGGGSGGGSRGGGQLLHPSNGRAPPRSGQSPKSMAPPRRVSEIAGRPQILPLKGSTDHTIRSFDWGDTTPRQHALPRYGNEIRLCVLVWFLGVLWSISASTVGGRPQKIPPCDGFQSRGSRSKARRPNWMAAEKTARSLSVRGAGVFPGASRGLKASDAPLHIHARSDGGRAVGIFQGGWRRRGFKGVEEPVGMAAGAVAWSVAAPLPDRQPAGGRPPRGGVRPRPGDGRPPRAAGPGGGEGGG